MGSLSRPMTCAAFAEHASLALGIEKQFFNFVGIPDEVVSNWLVHRLRCGISRFSGCRRVRPLFDRGCQIPYGAARTGFRNECARLRALRHRVYFLWKYGDAAWQNPKFRYNAITRELKSIRADIIFLGDDYERYEQSKEESDTNCGDSADCCSCCYIQCHIHRCILLIYNYCFIFG